MPGPVLLVHDDIAAIATVRRLLSREGLETILATSAADALIAFGHFQPALLVLATAVEGGRGRVVLDELALHPEASRARVILLGERVEGSPAVTIPLPLDGASFLDAVRASLESEPDLNGWRVQEQDWSSHSAALEGAEEIEAEDPGDATDRTQPAFPVQDFTAFAQTEAAAEQEKQRAVEAARALGAFEATETMRGEVEVREAELAQREGALQRLEVALLSAEDERDRLRAEAAAKAQELARLSKARELELRELNAELDAARAKRSGASTEREAAVARLSALETEVAAQAQALAEAQAEREEAQRASEEQIRALEEDVSALRRNTLALEQALEETEAERARSEKAHEEAKAQTLQAQGLLRSSLEDREAQARERIEGLERELSTAREQAEAADRDRRSASERIVSLEQALVDAGEQRQADLARIEALEQALAQANGAASEQLAAASEEGAEQQVRLEAAQARIAELEAAHESLGASAGEAEAARRAELEAAQARIAELEAAQESLGASAGEAEAARRAELEAAQARILELEAAQESLGASAGEAEAARRAELEAAQARISELEAAQESLGASAGAAQARIAELESEQEGLRAAASEEGAEHQVHIEAARARIAELKQEREASRAEAIETDAAHRAQLEAAQGRIAELEAAQEAAGEAESAHQAQLEAAQGRIAELEAAQEAAGEAESAQLAQLEAAQGRIAELETAQEAARAAESAQLEAAQNRISELEAAQESSRVEVSEAEAAHHAQLEAARARIAELEAAQETSRAEVSEAEAAHQAQLESARGRIAELEAAQEATLAEAKEALERHQAELEAAQARSLELEQERELLRAASAEGAEHKAHLEAAQARIAELEPQLAEARQVAESSTSEWTTAAGEAEALRDSLEVLDSRYVLLQRELERARRGESEAEKRMEAIRSQSQATIEGLRAYAEPLAARIAELEAQVEHLTHDGAAALAKVEAALEEQVQAHGAVRVTLAETEARARDAETARDRLEAEGTSLGEKLNDARAALAQARAHGMTLESALEELRAEAEGSKAEAQRLADQILRTQVPLLGPGQEPWTLAQSGAVDLVGLARLSRKLALAEAEVRLELRGDAARVLWLRGGKLVAASSAHDDEWLGASAHREGLVDARQLRELSLVRAGSDRSVLEGLQARGWIRDAEVAPLVRRHFERIALEALSAEETRYRIVIAEVPEDALVAAGERPLAVLITEALRRALPHFEAGTEPFRAAPRLLGRPDFERFGFTSPERMLLESFDGETTVQAALLKTGVRTELSLRALGLAEALELIEVGPAVADAELPPPPDLEVQRLSAKWEESTDADYFSVLGISRTAGAPEVDRAFHALSEEFHPLRFVGHPDARWRVRAEALQSVFREAALALADDRLRAEYARNLAE